MAKKVLKLIIFWYKMDQNDKSFTSSVSVLDVFEQDKKHFTLLSF